MSAEVEAEMGRLPLLRMTSSPYCGSESAVVARPRR